MSGGRLILLWPMDTDFPAVALDDSWQQISFQMLLPYFDCGSQSAEFPGNIVPIGRNQNLDFLLRKLIEHHTDGRAKIRVRSHDQRLVEIVQMRVLDQMNGKVNVAFLLLVCRPFSLAAQALAVIILELSEDRCNTGR